MFQKVDKNFKIISESPQPLSIGVFSGIGIHPNNKNKLIVYAGSGGGELNTD